MVHAPAQNGRQNLISDIKSPFYTFSAQKTLTQSFSTLNRKLQYPNTRLLGIRCQNRDQHPRKPRTVRFPLEKLSWFSSSSFLGVETLQYPCA